MLQMARVKMRDLCDIQCNFLQIEEWDRHNQRNIRAYKHTYIYGLVNTDVVAKKIFYCWHPSDTITLKITIYPPQPHQCQCRIPPLKISRPTNPYIQACWFEFRVRPCCAAGRTTRAVSLAQIHEKMPILYMNPNKKQERICDIYLYISAPHDVIRHKRVKMPDYCRIWCTTALYDLACCVYLRFVNICVFVYN